MKDIRNTKAVSELVGTILLLGIAVSAFSVIYLQFANDNGPAPETYINIVGDIIKDVDIMISDKFLKEVVVLLMTKQGYMPFRGFASVDISHLYKMIHCIFEPISFIKKNKVIQLLRPGSGLGYSVGEIPVLGWLFKGRRKVYTDMQLLIFITTTII